MSQRKLDDREQAQKLMNDGNWKEALDAWLALLRKPRSDGPTVATDWLNVVTCLSSLQRLDQMDGLLEEQVGLHGDKWELLQAAADSLMAVEHYGFVVAGEFNRGQARGGGEWANVMERDRVRALKLLETALPVAVGDADKEKKGRYFQSLAAVLEFGRMNGNEWRLQELTDTGTLPDVQMHENNWQGYGRGEGGARGAPVDPDGNPVFYSVPKAWIDAASDGERWRWVLKEGIEHDNRLEFHFRWSYVSFLDRQFGVAALQNWGINLSSLTGSGDETAAEKDPTSNPMALRTLADNETIARLATGVRKLELPDEHNPIFLAKEMSDVRNSAWGSTALDYLARIYTDRQQFPRAAKQWQLLIERYGNDDYRRGQLNQIIAPWGMLENTTVQPAGTGATLQYRFRNGRGVTFEARRIDQQKMLSDTIAYVSSRPAELDWQRLQVQYFQNELLEGRMKEYVAAEPVATWKVQLEPRAEHFDRRTTVSTPLQQPGAYLVTAKMDGGNTTHVVVWIDSLAILKKPVNGKSLYYLANAVDGSAVPNADVEFFGWRQEWNEPQKRHNVLTKRFSQRTDRDGFVLTDPGMLDNQYQFLTIAKTADGQLGWMGFSNVWAAAWNSDWPERTVLYVISDRPVYRPGQTVQFKMWAREASYRPGDELFDFSGKTLELVINDPLGNEVRRENVSTDRSGAVAGTLVLDENAKLGAYTITAVGQNLRDKQKQRDVWGNLSFRVEEYKKPEFEVSVDLPKEPVQLGDKVTAKIRAEYYFGGPVTNATVKYKVHRTTRDVRWYPVRHWDWLYGNGYWWFGSDYPWYPGFRQWGCFAPIPPWWGGWSDPPELVIDEETVIGEDGTAEVGIDTALAKALHGDQDHVYTITAEVVDASRRTIVGTGTVNVARQPFRVYCWTDRGYARVGDSFTAHFAARTPDGQGVAGKAEIKLYSVKWNNNECEETEVQAWKDLEVGSSGEIQQIMNASQPGQFRIACTVDDGKGNRFEGGQVMTVTGDGFDGKDFRYNDLEITLDRESYNPGESVRLLVNTNRPDSTVLLWLRPADGAYAGRPVILKMNGKSTVFEIPVVQNDMPNFFVEASTISNAKVHEVVRNIVVPPMDKSIRITVEPSQTEYLPGAEATLNVKLVDEFGKPVVGDLVLTMYDRAVEYISGGSNVSDIREFFWKWTRSHNPNSEHSLGRSFWQFAKSNEPVMQFLGAFGHLTADQDNDPAQSDSGRMNKDERNAAPMSRAAGMGGGRGAEGMAMESAAAPMLMDQAAERGQTGNAVGGEGPPMAAATVRANFADSAYWNAAITTDADGTAQIKVPMPENLTSWKIRSWAIGPASSVGEASVNVTTKKNILVRLQAPRFFVEKDEVYLSAVVHNYLDVAKTARVSLDLGGSTLSPIDPNVKTVEIPAGGDVRVDWKVSAVAEGTAEITMTAQTDVESDAMKMSFPVFVHGMLKTESFSRVVRGNENSATIDLMVPAERRPEQTRLEVRYSPTLAGAMVDALPYLAAYPYGCTEQTLNRFVPTVVTLKILRNMNLDLRDIRDKQTNLNAQQIGDPAERAKQWKAWDHNPVFDPDEVESMVRKGISDLTAMQCSDGGWGWFSGYGQRSWPHTTAVVVHGLQTAIAADMPIPADVLERGVQWLKAWEASQVALLDEWVRLQDIPRDRWPREPRYKQFADNLDAMVHQVLADASVQMPKMTDYLYRDRNKLTLYGMGLVGLALDKIGDNQRRDMVIRNMDQFVVYDEENQSAYIDLPNNGGYWWYWYGDVIEANAWYLKLMSRVRPNDPKTAGVVKYLLNNRRYGNRWNSTRDTATCIEALAEYIQKTGEDEPEMTIEVLVDGKVRKAVEITKANIFSFDNALILEGADLESGPHKIELRRTGKGPVYANAYLTNFTMEDHITAAGLEVKVNRKFYKLVQRDDASATVRGARGEVVEQKSDKYDRVELTNLAEVVSGDLIEVELEIDSKNDYEYVIFEDMKAAGFEPVNVRSGYTEGGLGAYVEFRDEFVAFFMQNLARGKHSVSYRLRAEIPGKYSALPAKAWAMYAPELKGNSDEIRLVIEDKPMKE